MSTTPHKAASEPGKKPNTQMRQIPTSEAGCLDYFMIFWGYVLFIVLFPIFIFTAFRRVDEFERAVIFRNGRLKQRKPAGPGIFFVLPCVDDVTVVSLRVQPFDVPPQEILTRDSVSISVDAVVFYYVEAPIDAVIQVSNFNVATRLLAQTTLRNILGQKDLHEVLSEREQIALDMKIILDEATDEWGIKVQRVEIKDVRLPLQLQRAMAAEAEASREAKAKIIAAKGEQDASVSLKTAADTIAASPGAMQLRYLQTLTSISAEKNSTIIFPLPLEILPGYKHSKGIAHV